MVDYGKPPCRTAVVGMTIVKFSDWVNRSGIETVSQLIYLSEASTTSA